MLRPPNSRTAMWYQLRLLWFRLVNGSWIKARWFYGDLLRDIDIQPKTGRLHIEIVSHCWGYAHMMSYQLSSLVLHPPKNVDVTMTMYYCEEDKATVETLAFFAQQQVDGVRWNWQALGREELFRRAIGREQASRASQADWLWFADCDLIFGQGCLDGLAKILDGSSETLVFPCREMVSALLPDGDPMLAKDKAPRIKDIDVQQFSEAERLRATGAFQIVHGDVARALGYCGQTAVFMQPVDHWAKTYEDTTFRWLIDNPGTRIQIPSLFRIRHQSKGRYRGGLISRIRKEIRRIKGS